RSLLVEADVQAALKESGGSSSTADAATDKRDAKRLHGHGNSHPLVAARRLFRSLETGLLDDATPQRALALQEGRRFWRVVPDGLRAPGHKVRARLSGVERGDRAPVYLREEVVRRLARRHQSE